MAGRRPITDKGRMRQGRGEGEGQSYVPWVKVGDYPGRGFRSMIDCHVSERAAHAMSSYETQLRLIHERRLDVVDLRENYRLHIEETRTIAGLIGVEHPLDKNRKPYRLTLDLLLNCKDKDNQKSWQEAYDYKEKKELAKDRVMAEIDIKEAYCKQNQIKYKVWNEDNLDRVLTDNLIHLRFYHDPDDYPTIGLDRLKQMGPILYQQLTARDLPMSYACLEIDRRCGLSLGTALCMVYQLICKRAWEVDLHVKFRPDEQPLEILERNPGRLIWRERRAVMSDVRTKQMCKAVYFHLLAGMSLEAVGADLELPVREVKTLILEYRTRVLGNPKHQKSLKRVGKARKGTKRKG